MTKLLSKTLLGLAVAFSSSFAAAYDWEVLSANISAIQPNSMPNAVAFSVDTAAGSCGAGALLSWNGLGADVPTQQANAKAIFSLLLAAKATNRPVHIAGTYSGPYCVVSYIQML
ncbi:hypothetical protein [Andreprevotia chitinilytica]|uniref:hypothetical protein n=1 Tax=Andreprevotia chitinilytica TaxID=396808 RepID=UPI0012EBBB34|nr:hypothetical protein [Andreprevotia chitinilytica]